MPFRNRHANRFHEPRTVAVGNQLIDLFFGRALCLTFGELRAPGGQAGQSSSTFQKSPAFRIHGHLLATLSRSVFTPIWLKYTPIGIRSCGPSCYVVTKGALHAHSDDRSNRDVVQSNFFSGEEGRGAS